MSNKKHELNYVYPPDFQKCKQHRKATRIFKGLQKDESGMECVCCERRIGVDNEPVECCYDHMTLAYLGPGIPLLFAFIKNSVIMIVVMTIVFVGFAVYSNITGGYCSTVGNCSSSVFNQLAIINKQNQQLSLSIQNFTVLGFVVVSIFMMQYFRYNFRKVQDECDDMITSPSDYALILRRLPLDTSVKDIEDMIQLRRGELKQEDKDLTENLKVINIVISFSMSDYTRVSNENKEEFSRLLDDGKHHEFTPKQLPNLQKTASFAIVIFERQESKSFFRYKPNIFQKLMQMMWSPCIPLSHYKVKDDYIAVERAPEPDDIIWQNSKISMKGAIVRKLLYSFMSIFVLLLGCGAQYGLALAQNKVSQDTFTQTIMSTAFSILVSILNAIIQIFLVVTSHKERNQTITEFNTVVMVKISLFQFLNAGVFTILAKFLANMTDFSLSDGLAFQITQIMILNAVLPNLTLFLLTYFQIIQKVQRWLVQRGTLKYSQMQANKIFEGPQAEIPYKYAYVFKTLWLTSFYAPMVPVVVPISVLGLLINYFLQKCLFGHSYAAPNTMSSMVNDSAAELMQYSMLIISIGNFIIYLYFASFNPETLPTMWSIPIYTSLGISFLHLILPMQGLNNKMFKMPKDDFVYPGYKQVEQKFQVTYEMTNPGYVCQRKRKRDIFIMNKLFASGVGVPLGDITGMGATSVRSNQKGLLTNQENVYASNQNGNKNGNVTGNLLSVFGQQGKSQNGQANVGVPSNGNQNGNAQNNNQNNSNNNGQNNNVVGGDASANANKQQQNPFNSLFGTGSIAPIRNQQTQRNRKNAESVHSQSIHQSEGSEKDGVKKINKKLRPEEKYETRKQKQPKVEVQYQNQEVSIQSESQQTQRNLIVKKQQQDNQLQVQQDQNITDLMFKQKERAQHIKKGKNGFPNQTETTLNYNTDSINTEQQNNNEQSGNYSLLRKTEDPQSAKQKAKQKKKAVAIYLDQFSSIRMKNGENVSTSVINNFNEEKPVKGWNLSFSAQDFNNFIKGDEQKVVVEDYGRQIPEYVPRKKKQQAVVEQQKMLPAPAVFTYPINFHNNRTGYESRKPHEQTHPNTGLPLFPKQVNLVSQQAFANMHDEQGCFPGDPNYKAKGEEENKEEGQEGEKQVEFDEDAENKDEEEQSDPEVHDGNDKTEYRRNELPVFKSKFQRFEWTPPEQNTKLFEIESKKIGLVKQADINELALKSMPIDPLHDEDSQQSSTREAKKVFKLQNNQMPFTKMQFLPLN